MVEVKQMKSFLNLENGFLLSTPSSRAWVDKVK